MSGVACALLMPQCGEGVDSGRSHRGFVACQNQRDGQDSSSQQYRKKSDAGHEQSKRRKAAAELRENALPVDGLIDLLRLCVHIRNWHSWIGLANNLTHHAD